MSAAEKTKPGTIVDGVLYTLEELRQRTGWGARAMREARRDGLPVRYRGGRAFVLGKDVLAFIEQHAETTYPSGAHT